LGVHRQRKRKRTETERERKRKRASERERERERERETCVPNFERMCVYIAYTGTFPDDIRNILGSRQTALKCKVYQATAKHNI
jgi:hypothetical protein